MTITIYTSYNERRNQLAKADAEVVDELPAIGDTTHGGQFIIDQVHLIYPDIATFSRMEACDYDYYWIHESDTSGDPDYPDEAIERYVAIRKPEKEFFSDLRDLTGQESGIILYENGNAIIANWASFSGLPRAFAGGLIDTEAGTALGEMGYGNDISQYAPENWNVVYDENGDYPEAVNAIKRFFWCQVASDGEEATVIAPLGWN